MKTLRQVISVKESHEQRLLGLPGVTGVAVGYKYKDGKRTDEIAVCVFVEKKKKQVPQAEKVGPELDGVVTDVIERKFSLRVARRKMEEVELMVDTGTYTPLKGGISIGPCRSVGGYIFTGTLGAIVRDNSTNDPMMLSNFHVMCIDNGWSAGDNMCQPSRVDTGSCPSNVVGSLQRAALTNRVDGAVASISGRTFDCSIVDIGNVAGTNTATLGMAVRKRGRTTGLTHGTVDSVSLSVRIDYEDGIGEKILSNQIGITPDTAQNAMFGDHGDSGSVVVDGSRKIVGLYFAGSDDGYGVANPIADVLTALNISVCTSVKSVLKDLKETRKDLIKERPEKLAIKDRKGERLEIKEQKLEKKEKAEVETKDVVSEIGPAKSMASDIGPKLREVPKYSEGGVIPPELTQPVRPTLPGAEAAKPQDVLKQKETFKEYAKEIRKDVSPKEKTEKPEKDGKDLKDQKEGKEHKEQKDVKEQKLEQKEYKLEAKEAKPEFEKPFAEGYVPKAFEGGPAWPTEPVTPIPGGLEDRIAALEAAIGELTTFISSELRPDLSTGALSHEADIKGTEEG